MSTFGGNRPEIHAFDAGADDHRAHEAAEKRMRRAGRQAGRATSEGSR